MDTASLLLTSMSRFFEPDRCHRAATMTVVMLAGLLPMASPAGDFAALLSGKDYALSVKLGDLDSQWRRITIHSTGSVSGNISVSVNGGNSGTSGSSQNNIADLTGDRHYVTKGWTVSAAGQDYLVAYRLPGSGLDLPVLIQALATKTPPTVATNTPETTLPLSLLDVKSIGSLDDIRAFDLKGEIAANEKLARTVEAVLKSSASQTNNAPAPAPAKQGK